MANTWIGNAGKPCCGEKKNCGVKCGQCAENGRAKPVWMGAGRVFDDNGVWRLRRLEGSDEYWVSNPIPYDGDVVTREMVIHDGAYRPFYRYGRGRTYYKYAFRCGRGGQESGFFLQLLCVLRPAVDDPSDWTDEGDGVVAAYDGFAADGLLLDQKPIGDLRSPSEFKFGVSRSTSSADGSCVNVDFRDIAGPEVGGRWIGPYGEPLKIRRAAPGITTSATVVIQKQTADCCNSFCGKCEGFYSHEATIEDAWGTHVLKRSVSTPGAAYVSDVLYFDSDNVGQTFYPARACLAPASWPPGSFVTNQAMWGPPLASGKAAYQYVLTCDGVDKYGDPQPIMRLDVKVGSTFNSHWQWACGGSPTPVAKPYFSPDMTNAVVRVSKTVEDYTCYPIESEFDFGDVEAADKMPLGKAKVLLNLYVDDRIVVCCNPVSIPQDNITASWSNSLIGDGSATLVYDGYRTWRQREWLDCQYKGESRKVRFLVECGKQYDDDPRYDRVSIAMELDGDSLFGNERPVYPLLVGGVGSLTASLKVYSQDPFHLFWSYDTTEPYEDGERYVPGAGYVPNFNYGNANLLRDLGFVGIDFTE